MYSKILLFVFFLQLLQGQIYGSNEKQSIRKGNSLYKDGQFSEAEIAYRKSLEENSRNSLALYNLANALYRQERYEEAAELFSALAQTGPEDIDRASAFHNLGNALLNAKKYAESVEAYKDALRINPADDDTRHNLAYAQKLLAEQPPQDDKSENGQQDDDKQDQQQDNQQNQDQDNQDNQDQQPESQDQQQGEEQEQQEEQNQQQQRPDQLSRQDAERILDALNQQEQKIQDQLKREQAPARAGRAEKQW